MIAPYYQDHAVTLWCGDMREVLCSREFMMSYTGSIDAVITDPPYGSTKLVWDRWVDGWPDALATMTNVLWCFGTFRMFWERKTQFSLWQLGQDVIWEKHNGSSFVNDRFRPVHEQPVMFYRGAWSELHRDVPTTPDAVARQVRRKKRPPQMGDVGEGHFVAEDGGPRQMRSVIYARGCHGYAVNETQKPEGIVAPLIHYSVPSGGVVLDCFAGSGTTLAVARRMGRRAIGIELREEQCKLIIERLAQRELALG